MERRRPGRDGETREAEPEEAAPARPAPTGILQLQQTVGNHAVTRILHREPAPGAGPVSLNPRAGDPLRPKEPFNPFALDIAKSDVGKEYAAAADAVRGWFDRLAKEAGAAGLTRSVPELVAAARELQIAAADGSTKPVADIYSVQAVEVMLRERAKTLGVSVLEHRSLDDPKGVESEVLATLKNLGAKIPTEVSFGGDAAKITIGIGGTVTSTLKPGGGKTTVEGEISKDGGKASVKFPGGKVGVEATDKSVKLDIKAGDLVSIKGSVKRSGPDAYEWKADLQIGTLGKLITPDEIGKVLAGAQETLGKSARDLADGVTVDKIKEHGGPVKEAVQGAVEKARKSAAQNKAGWQVGVSVQGGGKDGGVSGMVTLTWVF